MPGLVLLGQPMAYNCCSRALSLETSRLYRSEWARTHFIWLVEEMQHIIVALDAFVDTALALWLGHSAVRLVTALCLCVRVGARVCGVVVNCSELVLVSFFPGSDGPRACLCCLQQYPIMWSAQVCNTLTMFQTYCVMRLVMQGFF